MKRSNPLKQVFAKRLIIIKIDISSINKKVNKIENSCLYKMSELQSALKSFQEPNKINWKAVHLNREQVNTMLKKSEKNKKYCTLSYDFFSPKPA